ncbi:MAG: long-chain fatty acid--CoA ligase [Nakamurella sp.]
MTLSSILAESALRYPDREAVIMGDTRITYRQLWDETRRYAAVLRDQGVGPGDTVALLMPNVPDFPRVYYAALSLGAIVVPVHALLVAPEIAYVLRNSGAKVLVVAVQLMDAGAKGAKTAGVPVLATMGTIPGYEDVPRLDLLAASATPIDTYVQREPDDPAVVLYTSGTTGSPKGAVLSHLNMTMNAIVTATSVIDMRTEDKLMAALPLFHSFGQTVVMNAAFFVGAGIVLMPRFEPGLALAMLVEEEITIFAGVPTMYIALLSAARADPRRPALRICASGGSALPVAVIDKFKQIFDVDIYEGYGLSETSPVATFNQKVYGRKAGSIGKAVWGTDAAIALAEVEDRIEFTPAGEIGEIVLRGHHIFSGYLGNPEATKLAKVDGWFRTGDLGRVDEDGFFYIVDRKKDMILRGGFNVYPREVEEVLATHPGVAQVAVVGFPDDLHGEEICAVVVRSPEGASLTAEELIDWSKENLGRYKYPRRVEFVKEMPLGPSGKVLKRELAKGL